MKVFKTGVFFMFEAIIWMLSIVALPNAHAQNPVVIPADTLIEINHVGVYKGKSLYIHNPYIRQDTMFCIEDIRLNESSLDLNLNSPAIEISFREDLLYSPVALKIYHYNKCKPRILNPDAIVIHSSFKFEELAINDSALVWSVKGDRDDGIYEIERLDVETWNVDTIVHAEGVFKGATYTYYPLMQSGANKFRIKYVLPSGRYLYSHELEYEYYPELIQISPAVVTDKLTLSRAIDWEITDTSGKVILSGSNKIIPLRRLRSGDYYIRLGEDQIEGFVKK